MSGRVKVGDTEVIVIAEEPAGTCELCGTEAELRPYGPNGERICHPCGMKDRATTDKRMGHILFGDPLDS